MSSESAAGTANVSGDVSSLMKRVDFDFARPLVSGGCMSVTGGCR